MKFDNYHPRLMGFDELYKQKLKPLLDASANKRRDRIQKHIRLFKYQLIFGLGLVVILFYLELALVAFGVLIVGSIVLVHLYLENKRTTQKFNSIILHDLCNCFAVEYEEHPHDKNLEEFLALKLIDQYSHKIMRDGINWTENDVKFKFFTLTTWIKQQAADGTRSSKELFDGVCLKADFHKKLKGTTFLYVGSKLTGSFDQYVAEGMEAVDLEFKNFEAMYDVYSSDQLEARYILTPTFVNRVEKFHNTIWRHDFKMMFNKNGIYIAVDGLNSMFKGGGHETSDRKFIISYINNIKLVLRFMEDLDLSLKTKI